MANNSQKIEPLFFILSFVIFYYVLYYASIMLSDIEELSLSYIKYPNTYLCGMNGVYVHLFRHEYSTNDFIAFIRGLMSFNRSISFEWPRYNNAKLVKLCIVDLISDAFQSKRFMQYLKFLLAQLNEYGIKNVNEICDAMDMLFVNGRTWVMRKLYLQRELLKFATAKSVKLKSRFITNHFEEIDFKLMICAINAGLVKRFSWSEIICSFIGLNKYLHMLT